MRKLEKEEVKKIQLRILKNLVSHCEEYNYRYYLAYGTLLGAIRHNGFIPWDDDIDLLIPRPDYEKLLETYNADGRIISHNSDGDYLYPFGKVVANNTIIEEDLGIKYENLGVYIDVFPIDGLPHNKSEQVSVIKKIKFYRNLLDAKLIKICKNRSIAKNILLILTKAFALPINYRKLIKNIDKEAQRYNYDMSEEVGCIVWGYGSKEIMDRKIFDGYSNLNFEGYNLKGPIGYHTFLTQIYGDYMELPPKEKRTTHHNYVAYFIER